MGVTLSRVGVRALAALAVLVSCGLACAQGASAAAPTRAFAVPGNHPYTVPAGVASITVKAVGAAGGNCTPAHGGRGASLTATVPVTPGEALVVVVGGFGGPCGKATAPGGIGGGGAGGVGTTGTHGGFAGAGGGGATVVAPGTSSPNLAQALVVAGGGGGSTQDYGAGSNGGDAGSPGQNGTASRSGGGAGTQSAGGTGGVQGDNSAQPGFSGSLGAGGAGGHGDMTVTTSTGGGGGGGGYYGGGGGGGGAAYTFNPVNPGGGGGGSSYVITGGSISSGPAPTSGGPEVIITPHAGAGPRAKITGATISSGLHTAKFAFKAIGHSTGFQCALVKKRHGRWSRASFSTCHSPKLYGHLKHGRYKFEVRSVSSGARGKPVGKRFTIT